MGKILSEMYDGFNIPEDMKNHPKFQSTWATNSEIKKVFGIFKRYGKVWYDEGIDFEGDNDFEEDKMTGEHWKIDSGGIYEPNSGHKWKDNTEYENPLDKKPKKIRYLRGHMEFEDEMWSIDPEELYTDDEGTTNNFIITYWKNKNDDDNFDGLSINQFLQQMKDYEII